MLDAKLMSSDDAAGRAAMLRESAEYVDGLAKRLDARVHALHYQGAAAERFRSSMADRSQRAHHVSRQLADAADRLTAHAG